MSTKVINDSLGNGLLSLKETDFIKSFQVSDTNPMLGVSSRVQLLKAVGSSLLSLPKIFGQSGRPGNLVGKSQPQALAIQHCITDQTPYY